MPSGRRSPIDFNAWINFYNLFNGSSGEQTPLSSHSLGPSARPPLQSPSLSPTYGNPPGPSSNKGSSPTRSPSSLPHYSQHVSRSSEHGLLSSAPLVQAPSLRSPSTRGSIAGSPTPIITPRPFQLSSPFQAPITRSATRREVRAPVSAPMSGTQWLYPGGSIQAPGSRGPSVNATSPTRSVSHIQSPNAKSPISSVGSSNPQGVKAPVRGKDCKVISRLPKESGQKKKSPGRLRVASTQPMKKEGPLTKQQQDNAELIERVLPILTTITKVFPTVAAPGARTPYPERWKERLCHLFCKTASLIDADGLHLQNWKMMTDQHRGYVHYVHLLEDPSDYFNDDRRPDLTLLPNVKTIRKADSNYYPYTRPLPQCKVLVDFGDRRIWDIKWNIANKGRLAQFPWLSSKTKVCTERLVLNMQYVSSPPATTSEQYSLQGSAFLDLGHHQLPPLVVIILSLRHKARSSDARLSVPSGNNLVATLTRWIMNTPSNTVFYLVGADIYACGTAGCVVTQTHNSHSNALKLQLEKSCSSNPSSMAKVKWYSESGYYPRFLPGRTRRAVERTYPELPRVA